MPGGAGRCVLESDAAVGELGADAVGLGEVALGARLVAALHQRIDLGIIAAAKKDQPDESAKYTRWGWIAVVIGLVLSIIAVFAFFALVAVGGSNYDSSY